MNLVTGSGEKLPIVEHIRAMVQLGELELLHDFAVVSTYVPNADGIS